MTEAEARIWVEDETQWQAEPALTTLEVARLVDRAKVTDSAGVAPGEIGYVDTFTASDLYRAAATGWRWKAGKVAAKVDVGAGDGVYAKQSQQYALCQRQAESLARKAGAGIGVIHLMSAGAVV